MTSKTAHLTPNYFPHPEKYTILTPYLFHKIEIGIDANGEWQPTEPPIATPIHTVKQQTWEGRLPTFQIALFPTLKPARSALTRSWLCYDFLQRSQLVSGHQRHAETCSEPPGQLE